MIAPVLEIVRKVVPLLWAAYDFYRVWRLRRAAKRDVPPAQEKASAPGSDEPSAPG